MCGRIACLLDPQRICSACNSSNPPQWKENSSEHGKFYPSANIMPSRCCPILYRMENGELVIQPMIWGLIPPWHKGLPTGHKLSTNNARIESVESSKLYKRLTSAKNRCIVLAQGFYEWRTVGAKKGAQKEPFFIFQGDTGDANVKVEKESEVPELKKEKRSKSEKAAVKVKEDDTKQSKPLGDVKEEPTEGTIKYKEGIRLAWADQSNYKGTKWCGPQLLKMAGLYDIWKSEDGNDVFSFTVITMASNSSLSWLHDRMPAILESDEQCEAWLNGDDLKETLKPATHLQFYAVDSKVGNSRCRDEDCMDPLGKAKPKKEASFMSNWLKRPGGEGGDADGSSPPKAKKK